MFAHIRRTILCGTALILFASGARAGELVGTEAQRELLYPNVVPPQVIVGGYGSAPAQFLDIRDVEFGPGGYFYVADCAANRVQKFSLSGNLAGAVEVTCPTSLAARGQQLLSYSDKDGAVSIIDPSAMRVEAKVAIQSSEASTISADDTSVYVVPRHGAEMLVASGPRLKTLKRVAIPGFAWVSDIAVDRGTIDVVDKYDADITELTPQGQVVRKFGIYGTHPGEMANPHGIAVANGNIFIADTVNHRLQEFASDGRLELQWGRHPIAPTQTTMGRMHYPHNVAASADGQQIVVCEPFEYRCEVFLHSAITKKYQASNESAYWNKFFWFHYRGPAKGVSAAFLGQPGPDYLLMGEEDIHRIVIAPVIDGIPQTKTFFGEFGSGPGQFKGPEGVFAGQNRIIYVPDTGNNRVEMFDFEGKYKGEFGKFGAGPGELNAPGQGSVDAQNNLYISDSGNKRVDVFDKDGRFLRSFGQAGTGPGQLSRPIDAFVDMKNNRVLVDDLYNAKIVVYSTDGKYLFEFGGQGTDIGKFMSPHSVIYDPDQDAIFVSDMTANNIQKFTRDGKFVARIGRYGTALGEFKTPAGLATLNGKLMVMDHTNHRGQIIEEATGFPQLAFGESVIGVPTDILNAKAKIEELQLRLDKLSRAKNVKGSQIRALAEQIGSIKAGLDHPAILDTGHH